ncbi:TonB family protein [Novosphingobium sp. Leaf2]|uniref:TonB family protein n=1 Tax=Novosphingobium sp. Leaf2 TaxID=1735670 RepID=UPI001F1648D7|nr:TonB family protein [Novosphingobium sp. Leaf2]
MLLIIALAAAPSAQASQDTAAQVASTSFPRGVRLLSKAGDLIRPEDYPATAVAQQTEGAVGFTVQVDPNGRVSHCAVTTSSGNEELDVTTCNLVTLRAMFDPARDRKGRAIASTYSTRVVWKMNDPRPAPEPMNFVSTFILETDGTVSDCKVEGSPMTAPQVAQAQERCTKGEFLPYRDDRGQPVRRRVRATQSVTVAPAE